MIDIHQLKQRLEKAKNKANLAKIELNEKQQTYHVQIDLIKKLRSQIEERSKTKEIKISDHAILRYLERIEGINLNDITTKIIDQQTLNIIDNLGGTGTYPSFDFSIVMKDYTVVTVKNNDRNN